MSELSATRWTIVQAARAGDEQAVRALFTKYWPAVVRYLERRGMKHEAEDVAQEVLVDLIQQALQKVDPAAGRFRGLVFAIARNLHGKHLERATAQKRGGGKVQLTGDFDLVGGEAPDDDFDREWLGLLIQGGLARLAQDQPQYFECLKRFALDGEPQADIAAALGVPTGVVKKRVFRAKRKLATYLQEEVWRYACSAGEFEAELRYLGRLLGQSKFGVQPHEEPEDGAEDQA